MPAKRGGPQQGFTLIEVIVFIVVMGVALSGVLLVINQSMSHSADPMIQIRATQLGQAYLDEILSKKFDQNTGNDGQTPRCGSTDPGAKACSTVLGPDSGETRASYNDVDDYNGLSESPPRDSQGNIRPGYDAYRVAVDIAYAGSELGPAGATLAATNAKRVTVTVTTPQGESIPFMAYRSNF